MRKCQPVLLFLAAGTEHRALGHLSLLHLQNLVLQASAVRDVDLQHLKQMPFSLSEAFLLLHGHFTDRSCPVVNIDVPSIFS